MYIIRVDPSIKGGVPVRANLKFLRSLDNKKDGRFVERLCRFTARAHASPFSQKLLFFFFGEGEISK